MITPPPRNAEKPDARELLKFYQSIFEDGIPVGTEVLRASTTVPQGWVEEDGSAINRTEHPLLFALIGITYGSGDGSTTFNVPDLSGNVPDANHIYMIRTG